MATPKMARAVSRAALTAEPNAVESCKLAAFPGLVGVLGGMGPLATVDFMRKMLDATPARCDQEHVPALVCSIPQIPDRTKAFQGRGDSPLPALLACAERLKAGGASLIVMPCNTAHLWFDEIQSHSGMAMLHIVDVALDAAFEVAADTAGAAGNPRIGLLATTATIASALYTSRNGPPPRRQPADWVLPSEAEITQWVTPGIAAVKAGRLQEGESLLRRAAAALHARGATSLVLGCTEIPLVLHDGNSPVATIDATAALARRAVQWSRQARGA